MPIWWTDSTTGMTAELAVRGLTAISEIAVRLTTGPCAGRAALREPQHFCAGNELAIDGDRRQSCRRGQGGVYRNIELLRRRASERKSRLVRRELTQCVQLIRMRNLLVEQLKQHVALRRDFQCDRRYRRRFHPQNLETRFRRGSAWPSFEGRHERQSDTAGRKDPGRRLLRPRMAKLQFG